MKNEKGKKLSLAVMGLALVSMYGCSTFGGKTIKVEDVKNKKEEPDRVFISDNGTLGYNSKHDVDILSVKGMDFNWKIYGDPAAAPLQVFSDENRLYLQFREGGIPPLPMTREGNLIAYEMRGPLMIIPKVESVVLRYGVRKAYVDNKNVEVIGQSLIPSVEIGKPCPGCAIPEKLENMGVMIPSNLAKNGKFETYVPSNMKGTWEVCHGKSLIEYVGAKNIYNYLNKKGVSVYMKGGCKVDGFVDLKRIME